MLKVGLERKLKMEMTRVTGNMSKLKHVKKTRYTETAYVRSCSMKELTELLKLKLKMTSLKCNYGDKDKCKLCHMNEETEEHLIECTVAREKVGYGSIDGENKYELTEIVRYLEK